MSGAYDEWMAQYDAWEATRDRMRAEFIEQARARFARDRVVSVESYGDEIRFTSSLTKATRPGVAYQLTDFEGDEPIGHHEYDDLDEALQGLWDLASPRTRGVPPMPNPNRNPSDRPPFKYRYLGTDDEESVCGCCGRQDLKRVAWLVALDEEGNELGEPVPYGTTCAGLLLRDVHHAKGAKKPSKGQSEKLLKAARQEAINEAVDATDYPAISEAPEPIVGMNKYGVPTLTVGPYEYTALFESKIDDSISPPTIRRFIDPRDLPRQLVAVKYRWINDERYRRAREQARRMGLIGVQEWELQRAVSTQRDRGRATNPSGRLRRTAARISNP